MSALLMVKAMAQCQRGQDTAQEPTGQQEVTGESTRNAFSIFPKPPDPRICGQAGHSAFCLHRLLAAAGAKS